MRRLKAIPCANKQQWQRIRWMHPKMHAIGIGNCRKKIMGKAVWELLFLYFSNGQKVDCICQSIPWERAGPNSGEGMWPKGIG